MAPASTLAWSDYLIFGLLVFFYAIIGVYFRWQNVFNRLCKKHKTLESDSIWSTDQAIKEDIQTDSTDQLENNVEKNAGNEGAEDVFLANRTLTILPVFASTAASFFSAVNVIGSNAEIYKYGAQLVLINLSHLLVYPLIAEVFIPVFYNLRLKSPHQYLTLRFFQPVGIIASVLFIMQMTLYVSVALYAPALSLHIATGWNLSLTIVGSGLLTIFYTVLGGLRAVVWTDFFQISIMFIGYVLIIGFGTGEVGGAEIVYNRALEGGKLFSISWDPNPFIQYTFWSLFVGGFCARMALSINATQLQRYISCRNLKTAKIACHLNAPTSVVFGFLQVICAMFCYSYFFNCDPVLDGKIKVYDSLFPYLIMSIFANVPVLRGLFISVIFAAALSTISSGINSLAYVFVQDIFMPVIHYCKPEKTFRPKVVANIGRLTALILGLCVIGGAFGLYVSPPSIFRIVLSVMSGFGGPVFIVFTIGLLFPYINKWGGLAAILSALVTTLWLGLGTILYATGAPYVGAPFTTSGCVNANVSTTTTSWLSSTTTPTPPTDPFNFYNLSQLYHSAWGMCVGFAVGSVVTALTGMNTKQPLSRSLFARQVITVYDYLPFFKIQQTIKPASFSEKNTEDLKISDMAL